MTAPATRLDRSLALLFSLGLALAACSSTGGSRPPASGGAGGTSTGGSGGGGSGGSAGGSETGGSGGSGGSGGGTAGSGGSGGSGGSEQPDASTAAPEAGGGTGGDSDAGVTPDEGSTPAPDASSSTGAGKTVLFVWGYGEHKIPGPKPGDPLMALDATMQKRLEARGLQVELAIDEMSKATDVSGKAFLLISSSVNRTKLFDGTTARFKSAPIPAIVMKDGVIEVMGVGQGPPGGFSTGVGETLLTITAPDDPLAAGLMGDVSVYTKGDRIIWSNPAPAARKIAIVKGNPSEVAIFAYPSGAMMAGGFVAPAKRMAFFIHRDTDYSANGLKLFDAAVDYLLAP